MEFRTVKNITAIPQSIVYSGTQHVLMPLEERNFDEAVAARFLAVCGQAVSDTTDLAGSAYTLPSEAGRYTWLANMTGNPDLPETTKANEVDDKGITRKVDAPNPMRQYRDLRWELKGGHEQWTGQDGGLWQRSLPSKEVCLPAKRRIRIESEIAEQVLSRDARSAVPGAIIKSREPSGFEPTMEWEIDDVRAYCKLIDPTMNIGLDSNGLARQAQENSAKLKDVVTAAKSALLSRLYFRIANPAYRLPTRAEFQEYVTGKPTEEVVREEVEKLLEQSDKDAKRGLRKLNA